MHPDNPCLWPPKVDDEQDLGYIEDSKFSLLNKRYYPRDIGRSSWIPGHDKAVFQFGDTFVHDHKAKFVNVSCSNAAIVSDPARKPTIAGYSGVTASGEVPVNPPLIPGEQDNDGYRTTTWCFGGIVFDTAAEANVPGVAEGWTYFQKSRINLSKWEEIIEHAGLAKVTVNTKTDQVSMTRDAKHDVLFTKEEPKFGTFSAVLHDDYIYAYGHGAGNSDVHLARVAYSEITQRSSYEYYSSASKSFQSDLSASTPAITGFQHGSIYHLPKLFGPGKEWVLIGCNSFADSTVHIGVASNPEGPFDIQKFIAARPKLKQDDVHFTYCVYGHPWAFGGQETNELMITWSEGGMKGRVVAAKVRLATEHQEQSKTIDEKAKVENPQDPLAHESNVSKQKGSLMHSILGKLKNHG